MNTRFVIRVLNLYQLFALGLYIEKQTETGLGWRIDETREVYTKRYIPILSNADLHRGVNVKSNFDEELAIMESTAMCMDMAYDFAGVQHELHLLSQ